eukprot:3866730-Amphidinium_carterae.1
MATPTAVNPLAYNSLAADVLAEAVPLEGTRTRNGCEVNPSLLAMLTNAAADKGYNLGCKSSFAV